MTRHLCRSWTVLTCTVSLAWTAAAAEPGNDLNELRAELAALRQDYETRIDALNARVEAAESAARSAEARAGQIQIPAAPAPTPVPAAPASSVNAFNPAISAIFQGRAAAISGPDGHRDIPGFLTGEEAGVGPDGLSVGETELALSANGDDRFYGQASVSLNDDGGETTTDLEEAFLQTLALPAGLTLKAGKFFSGIGYQNSRHAHAWDFEDQPLAYEALLDGQLSEPGVQLTWLAPTEQYLLLGGELLRGENFPTGGSSHSGKGAYSLFAKTSGEIGDSNTWQAGLSYLSADARGRESEDEAGNLFSFDGDTQLWIAEFVWKWAPQGNYRERNLVLQAEYLHRTESGDMSVVDAAGVPFAGRYRSEPDGAYVQAVYQFMPRFRFGLRYDQLWSDARLRGLPPDLLDDGERPGRASAMLDFSNSEFSRLRLQWNHQWGGFDGDDAVFLQYILSLGSHGAHTF